ncbi:alpha/beta fold hydrolase [Sphingobium rhizovicinum]|uniref:Alpha/beta fold hydrolase n=1 Tax=Sphingobium rhizovicinum TaxID=432308 RepID=A0ABV7NLI6_9SPHN
MTFHRTYVDGRWGQVHVRIAPGPQDAPPLLMLHQTPKSGWIWEPLFARLAQGRTLIAPDTPGYGASDGPGEPVSIEDYAAEMLALMDRLAEQGVIAGGAFDAIGYHTGSLIATATANLAADRVRQLVLVSLGALTPKEKAGWLAQMPQEPPLLADGSHLIAMWQMIDGFTDPRASLRWKQDSLTENLRSGAGFYHGYRAVAAHDFFAGLERLAQPTLILNPEDDLWRETHRAAACVPQGRMVELCGAGHGLFAIETDIICDLVEAHLV